MKAASIACAGRRLDLGGRTLIMGIVNVTPDSFSDGGRFFDPAAALDHGQRLVAEGADILDLGGESTRPFSEPVPAEEEIRRVVPVIAHLAKHLDAAISIDTTKAEVAQRAIDAGAGMINDVSALRADPEMAELAARSGAALVLMHMLGTPKTMQVNPVYENLLDDLRAFFRERIAFAVERGVDRRQILIDPGIGFGKTLSHNLCLIRHLHAFAELEAPVLIGPSRKAFIRRLLTAGGGAEPAPDSALVESGTQAAVCAAILGGADIVRVHDVHGTKATVIVSDALKNAAPM